MISYEQIPMLKISMKHAYASGKVSLEQYNHIMDLIQEIEQKKINPINENSLKKINARLARPPHMLFK